MRPPLEPPRSLPSFTVPRMSNNDVLSVMTQAVSYESRNMLDPDSLGRFQPGNPYLYPILQRVEEAEVLLVARSPTSPTTPIQDRFDRIMDSELISEFDLDEFGGDERGRDVDTDIPRPVLESATSRDHDVLPPITSTQYEPRQRGRQPETWTGDVTDITSSAVRFTDAGTPMPYSRESSVDSFSTSESSSSARMQSVAANLLDLDWEMDTNDDALREEDLAAIQAIVNELEIPDFCEYDAVLGDDNYSGLFS
jgi:hypothetical protein